MADKGPLAPQPSPVKPPVVPPVPPVQLPAPPVQPVAAPTQPVQPGHMPQLIWSHLKPEFTGKPDEDVEPHLPRTNDLMYTHAFQEGFKIQRICLTLVAEARLWSEPLRPIALIGMGYRISLDSSILK